MCGHRSDANATEALFPEHSRLQILHESLVDDDDACVLDMTNTVIEREREEHTQEFL
jgi:hypothetical protein